MPKTRLTNPPKANTLSENPMSQYKNPRNPSLITQSLSTCLITRNSCSGLEQSETSSGNIEILIFYISDNQFCKNLPTITNQILNIICIFTKVFKVLF